MGRDCIEPLGLTIGEAAAGFGVTRQTLDRLVDKRGGVSPELALRLASAFGGSAEMWLRLQATFDLIETRKHMAGELADVRRVARAKEPA